MTSWTRDVVFWKEISSAMITSRRCMPILPKSVSDINLTGFAKNISKRRGIMVGVSRLAVTVSAADKVGLWQCKSALMSEMYGFVPMHTEL